MTNLFHEITSPCKEEEFHKKETWKNSVWRKEFSKVQHDGQQQRVECKERQGYLQTCGQEIIHIKCAKGDDRPTESHRRIFF